MKLTNVNLESANLANVNKLKLNTNKETEEKTVKPFSEFLKKSIYDVSDARKNVEQLDKALIEGKVDNLHEVTIAQTVANIKFQALSEVSNKVMEAYKEIIRIQI